MSHRWARGSSQKGGLAIAPYAVRARFCGLATLLRTLWESRMKKKQKLTSSEITHTYYYYCNLNYKLYSVLRIDLKRISSLVLRKEIWLYMTFFCSSHDKILCINIDKTFEYR